MIAVAHEKSSMELMSTLVKLGVQAYAEYLPFGDYCFEGYGPDGKTLIGIERKKIPDMLNSIESGRYSGHQQPGMVKMYPQFRYLLLEGRFRSEVGTGILLIPYKGGWVPARAGRQRTMYSSLFRFLVSVKAQGGTNVIRSEDERETAEQIVNLFHYFQKPWDKHTSQLKAHTQAIAQFVRPKYCQRAAAALDGVADKHSLAAQRLFKTAPAMMNATELDWMKIPGIGPKLARQIVKEIWDL